MSTDLDLEAILAAARAAKQEAESGSWAVGDRFVAHTVTNKPGPITMQDDSPRCLVSSNSNFESRAVLAHIAAADPDTVIALVEQLQASDADLRDLLLAHTKLTRERDSLQGRCESLEARLREADADVEAIGDAVRARSAELDTLLVGIAALHTQVDQTDPACPVGVALTKAGLTEPPGVEAFEAAADRMMLAAVRAEVGALADRVKAVRLSPTERSAWNDLCDIESDLRALATDRPAPPVDDRLAAFATTLDVLASDPRAALVAGRLRGIVEEMRAGLPISEDGKR